MKLLLYTTILFLLHVSPAWCQMSIKLKMEHRKLVHHEPVLAFITLSNVGFEVFKLTDGKAKEPRVELVITRSKGDLVTRISDKPIVDEVSILPRDEKRFMVNVSRLYDVERMGGYMMHAEVYQQGLKYKSSRLYFDVVGGLPLAKTRYPVPGVRGIFRTYGLSYLARERAEFLFLSVTEEPSGKYFETLSLGHLVRVFPPAISMGVDRNVHVTHQSSPNATTRSILRSNKSGIALIDQKYKHLKGHIGADGTWTIE